MSAKLSSIPVVKLPLVDVSTGSADLMVTGLALRGETAGARTSPKFIELVHERRPGYSNWYGFGYGTPNYCEQWSIDTVSGDAEKLILFYSLRTVSRV